MFQLRNSDDEVINLSDDELIYDDNERGWRADIGLISDTKREFTLFNMMVQQFDFNELFTAKERIELRKLRATDSLVEDFLILTGDAKVTGINLLSESLVISVNYVLDAVRVAAGNTPKQVQDRIKKILTGTANKGKGSGNTKRGR